MSYVGNKPPQTTIPADGSVDQASFGLATGEYFPNPNTISTNMTTTVPATSSAAILSPITVNAGITWTISGTLSIL